MICSLLRWLLTLALMAYALMGGYYWMQHDCIGGREFNVDGHWYRCQLSSPETVCEAPR